MPDCDAVFICVSTPLTKNREPDTAYVENSAGFAERIVKTGGLVVLKHFLPRDNRGSSSSFIAEARKITR